MSNAEKYPDAWAFFCEHCRNVEGLPEGNHGKYRVPVPDQSGNFLSHDHPGVLFLLFKDKFYEPSHNSLSVYGKIQAIVNSF